jgi:hypothetical protein
MTRGWLGDGQGITRGWPRVVSRVAGLGLDEGRIGTGGGQGVTLGAVF